MRRVLFNPDSGGAFLFRTIKAVQYKQSWANFVHTSTYGSTAVMEIYETDS